MNQEQALEAISEKLLGIEKLLKECEKISRKASVSFEWGGPTYGMGGAYHPKSVADKTDYLEEGWNASSHSC